MAEGVATDVLTGAQVRLIFPEGIGEDSWLNDPKYAWFIQAYNYAATQTCAIPALSRCKAEELYSVFSMLMRGAFRAGHLSAAIESMGSIAQPPPAEKGKLLKALVEAGLVPDPTEPNED